MPNLRTWQLSLDQPYTLHIAADARLSATDPADDQVWEVAPGKGESAALALQTRYGGRAGLVSLVPMWTIDGQLIYQAAQYASAVTIRSFAPAFAQLQAKLAPNLALLAEFWAIESHAVGGRFTLKNSRKQPIKLRLDLLAFIGIEGHEQAPKIVPLPGERHALALGNIGDLVPMVMLDNGFAAPEGGGNKLSASITLAPGAKASLRFVCAGLPDPRESLNLARRCLLGEDWNKAFRRIANADSAPRIETGDADLDATLAFGYMQLMQAFIRTPKLPYLSIVYARARGKHTYSYLSAQVAYTTALAAAAVDLMLAQGVVRNYLSIQKDDGWIDGTPPIGDRPTFLLAPILARLAWSIFHYSEDSDFLREVFPGLLKFFERWLQPDLDVDGDGAPEWQVEAQLGYSGRALGDIRCLETPTLVAYLLSEAVSLREIAFYLRDSEVEARMKVQIARLRDVLETFWLPQAMNYRARDRDTHQSSHPRQLLKDGIGDEDHLLAMKLDPADRVVVEVVGGWQHTPKMTLMLEGIGADNQPLRELTDESAFQWQTGRGRYTSQAVFSQLDRVHAEGLVRVYRLNVFTPDFGGDDLDDWLPLWSLGLSAEQAAVRVENWKPEVRTGDAQPIGSYGTTIIAEGLIEYGVWHAAAALVQRALELDEQGLKQLHLFPVSDFKSEQGVTSSVRGHSAGLPPLHLLLRVIGVRVISKTKVWTGGAFAWGIPIKITHKGVVVERSADGTRITFPSKRVVELAADAEWQEVVDLPINPPHNRDRISASRLQ